MENSRNIDIKKNNDGFTLVELLAMISLLSIISVY